jgi:glycosyltransferase involved in cell wall biosynthesis
MTPSKQTMPVSIIAPKIFIAPSDSTRFKTPPARLAVIIPALNEDKTIASVITGIPRNMPGVASVETFVVDDGSTDQTVNVARAYGATVISHDTNKGVGAAFHSGLRSALASGADIIVNIDADGQFNPADIIHLIKPIQSHSVDFVTASRFADPALTPKMPWIKLLGNRLMTSIINFITKKSFTDVSCGFRAYSREAALRLTLFGHFTYTQETFIDLAFKNISMAEVPLAIRGVRQHGRSRVADNLWRYGLKTATIIFRAARDYRPHYFFGLPGLLIFFLGFGSGLFLFQHFLRTGQTFPYRSLVQLSGVLIIVGFLLLFLSLLADMMHRNRIIVEEAVYHARRASYDRKSDAGSDR